MNQQAKFKHIWICRKCYKIIETVHKLKTGERSSLCPKCRKQMAEIIKIEELKQKNWKKQQQIDELIRIIYTLQGKVENERVDNLLKKHGFHLKGILANAANAKNLVFKRGKK